MNGYFLCGSLLFLYYAVIFLGLKLCDPNFSKLRQKKHLFIEAGLVVICVAGFHVLSERYIYYWDYGAYWYWTIGPNWLEMKFSELFKILIQSIDQQDYNISLSLLVSIPLKFFGNSYKAFVILNTILFYIPNGIIISEAIYAAQERCGFSENKIRDSIVPFFAIGFSGFLLPILAGYVDIASCPFAAMAFLLILKRDENKIEWKKDLLLSCCLLGLILMRRYFAYVAVGGAAFVLPYWLTEKKLLKIRIIDLFVTVLPAFVIVYFNFPELVHRYLFNNFAVAYSAYNALTFGQKWLSLFFYFGILFCAFMFASLFVFVNWKISKLAWCFAFSFLTTGAIFFSTQDLGIHHYYIILFQACFLVYLGFAVVLEKINWGG